MTKRQIYMKAYNKKRWVNVSEEEKNKKKAYLKEYYQKTKPHLSIDEIDFLIEDKFSFDEEIDEERDIKRKKLAFKEELAGAKNHLNSLWDNKIAKWKLWKD